MWGGWFLAGHSFPLTLAIAENGIENVQYQWVHAANGI